MIRVERIVCLMPTHDNVQDPLDFIYGYCNIRIIAIAPPFRLLFIGVRRHVTLRQVFDLNHILDLVLLMWFED